MTNIQYSLIRNSGGEVITVFANGEMFSALDTHPNWAGIKAGAEADDPNVIDLFDIGRTAQIRFERLSERVTVRNGKVHWDNVPVHSALTEQVVRFIENGQEDFGPLVEFFEKVQTNENEHSREQLFDWLKVHDFTILPNGNFIGYKGVRVNGDSYESISHGNAISNGIEYTGAIPNPIGAVVEMPRDQVQHDPSVGCHTGLHVGTWEYASGFAQGAVLKVEVNPRDVVSVPTDCGWQKLRTCRYTVLEVIDAPVDGPLDMDPAVADDGGQALWAEAEEHYADMAAQSTNPIVKTMAGVVDTRFNHLRQKRDANGRFIPKSK
ncbi:rIIB-like protein [Streptomyces phage Samisti12]|uniref:Uncharacterized protein n=6 Tax=Samistivirus TaxID=2560220 RepID=A0A223G077_9CAUD|nr:RIIB lysis inhibitor [Streptomyces phage Peebs]YP_009611617.1 RIIB lysis inhibitor [Streptomyces phage Samisti12]ASR76605.1 rIIB-like protein [Streptomyces phage Sushi23]QAX95909.1 rIIB-like protein [Streptomyces phage Teutsch]QGH78365.1 rIIB-like protein [Streptomyces phage Tribute]QRI46166.1 rIIB-like protein [Streptomyces phage Cross]WDS51973.1 hypothetical protein SEA_PEPPERWOOD_219 [Streptomyces phage Pepperwood]WNN95537.1 rIIB-like protein [Streptomyces phage Watermoore]